MGETDGDGPRLIQRLPVSMLSRPSILFQAVRPSKIQSSHGRKKAHPYTLLIPPGHPQHVIATLCGNASSTATWSQSWFKFTLPAWCSLLRGLQYPNPVLKMSHAFMLCAGRSQQAGAKSTVLQRLLLSQRFGSALNYPEMHV